MRDFGSGFGEQAAGIRRCEIADAGTRVEHQRRAAAKLVGADPESDLAVLKIGLPDLPAIAFDPDPSVRVGDVVDSWRVIALEPDRRLTLLMEMKAPGAGVQELVVKPNPDGSGSSVTATAYWHPAGVPGLLYWYLLVPAHLFLFRGLTRAIQRRASAEDHSGSSTLRAPK